MRRRGFVAGVPAVLGSTAGCISLLLGSGDGHVRPDSEPDAVPESHQCDSTDLVPYGRLYDEEPRWGRTEQFRLRVDKSTAEYGETVTITLTNTSDHPVTTASDRQFQFEIYTADGWQEIRRCVDSCPVFSTVTVGHAPSTGFEWEIPLTEAGISDAGVGGVVVCPDLVSARYRFVFRGADTPVAVAFDLQRES
jgi:hypothetical protein